MPENAKKNFMRKKTPHVYASCNDFWQKGPVRFIAHAVYSLEKFVPLGKEVQADGGSQSPKNHPDQVFWDRVKSIPTADLVRIDIDCTLMPCDKDLTSCLAVIPNKIYKLTNRHVTVRFYSHRDEGLGVNSVESKRFFEVETDMSFQELLKCYNDHRYWKWADVNAEQFRST